MSSSHILGWMTQILSGVSNLNLLCLRSIMAILIFLIFNASCISWVTRQQFFPKRSCKYFTKSCNESRVQALKHQRFIHQNNILIGSLKRTTAILLLLSARKFIGYAVNISRVTQQIIILFRLFLLRSSAGYFNIQALNDIFTNGSCEAQAEF